MNIVFYTLLFFGLACSPESDAPFEEPELRITNVEVSEGNTNNTVQFTVALEGTNAGNVRVSYRTIDGTAKAGEDYEGVSEASLSFASNENEKVIEITLLGDEISEDDKTFDILLQNPQNARLKTDRATITILNDDNGGLPSFIPARGYTTPETYAGYQLLWADEFQGASLNSEDWTYEIGNGTDGWGNEELQFYKEENTRIEGNEYLVIEARQQNASGFDYTSSRIVTQNKVAFKYGRVDIRAALPKGRGIWPALWMLGSSFSTVGWPACGEIDIMELIGSEPNKVHGTVHWDHDGQYANYSGDTQLDEGIFADEFHVFSIVWDQEKITWLLDDEEYHVIDITPNELSEFQNEFFFIFNVAVGGRWPGSPDASTVFPQRMVVDYIRVFQ